MLNDKIKMEPGATKTENKVGDAISSYFFYIKDQLQEKLEGGNACYGDPEDFFGELARLWSTILNCKVTGKKVILCMILMKVLRYKKSALGKTHTSPLEVDTLLDLHGYTSLLTLSDHIAEIRNDPTERLKSDKL